MQWDSRHSLSAKYIVNGTLTHIAKTVGTDPELLPEGTSTLWEGFGKALVRCKYHPLAINKVQSKVLNSNWEDDSNNNLQNTSNNTTINREQQTQTGDNNN